MPDDNTTTDATEDISPEARRAARDAALSVLRDLRDDADPPGQLALSNGIVLKLKAPPPNLLREVAQRIPRPEPPLAFNEGKGIDEPNPLDPDYLAAMDEFERQQYLAAHDVALMFGTECYSTPTTEWRPEDDGWLDAIKIVDPGFDGSDIPAAVEGKPVPPARYWAWLRFYALRDANDQAAALYGTLLLSQLSEAEVAVAIAAFRRTTRRRSDLDGLITGDGADGPDVQAADTGDRTGDGGEGSGALRADDVDGMAGAPANGTGRGGRALQIVETDRPARPRRRAARA